MTDRPLTLDRDVFRALWLAEVPEFCQWYDDAWKHPQFGQAASLLASLSDGRQPRDTEQFEFRALWNCWRASTWRPDPFADENWYAFMVRETCFYLLDEQWGLRMLAEAIEESGAVGLHFAQHVSAAELRNLLQRLRRALEATVPSLEPYQHGPLLYHSSKQGRTRLPAIETLLAAKLATCCTDRSRRIDWTMISLFVSICVGKADPESLRVSAGKVLKLVTEGHAKLVGWPADIGATIDGLPKAVHLAPTPFNNCTARAPRND